MKSRYLTQFKHIHFQLALAMLLGLFTSFSATAQCIWSDIEVFGAFPPNEVDTDAALIHRSGAQFGRIFRNASASECPSKAYPGVLNTGTEYNYTAFQFINTSQAPLCITINFNTGDCETNGHAMVYQEAGGQNPTPYNTADQGVNYLGDVGSSITQPFSVEVGPGYFEVVVTNTAFLSDCNFSFTIVDGEGDYIAVDCGDDLGGWSHTSGAVGCGSEVEIDVEEGDFSITAPQCYTNNYTADAQAFIQRTLCGNGSITAQVTSITGGSGWAGVVMRETTDAGAKKVQLSTNLGNQLRREARVQTNGSAYPFYVPGLQRHWVRIVRQGNQFISYASINGINWQQVMVSTISMGECIEIGLALTNGVGNTTVTANFANVSYTGGGNNLQAAPTTSFAASSVAALMDPMATDIDFDVYPTATNGPVAINLKHFMGQSVAINLLDAMGRTVQTIGVDRVENAIEQADFNGVAAGIYFVQLKAANGMQRTQRLVIKP